MPDTPANQRSWWRQPPLWVGAAPLLIFLLVSAIDLALAKQFTDNGKAVIRSWPSAQSANSGLGERRPSRVSNSLIGARC